MSSFSISNPLQNLENEVNDVTQGGETNLSNPLTIGVGAGQTGQSANAVSLGSGAGLTTQGNNSVAIGKDAGATTQGADSVAIGLDAGRTNQLENSVAIGHQAGEDGQRRGVAIGYSAGRTNQGNNAVAVGSNSATTNQGTSSVSVGPSTSCQGNNAVCIGSSSNASANYSIVIGPSCSSNPGPGQIIIGGSCSGSSGNNNIVMGRSASTAGKYNVVCGSSSSVRTSPIAIGGTAGGDNNIVLGKSTSAVDCNGALTIFNQGHVMNEFGGIGMGGRILVTGNGADETGLVAAGVGLALPATAAKYMKVIINGEELWLPLFACGSPLPPTNNGSAAGDSKVDLSWNEPEFKVNPRAKGYAIYREEPDATFPSMDLLTIIDGAGTVTYTDTGLTNGTRYNYEIKAYATQVTAGEPSSFSTALTLGFTPAP